MHGKRCQGEIALHLFQTQAAWVVFHRGVQEFKVFLRQETSAKMSFTGSVLAWAH